MNCDAPNFLYFTWNENLPLVSLYHAFADPTCVSLCVFVKVGEGRQKGIDAGCLPVGSYVGVCDYLAVGDRQALN